MSRIISIDFSADGRYLVGGGGYWKYFESANQGETLLWDLNQGGNEPIKKVPHEQAVYSVAFHPTDHIFAAGGLDTSVKVVDFINQHEETLNDKSWWITGLAYSADGSRLATASPGQITFWDSKTRDQIGTLRVNEQVRRIAFLPNGNGIMIASTEGFVRLYRFRQPQSHAGRETDE